MTQADKERFAQLERRITDLETTVKELAARLDQAPHPPEAAGLKKEPRLKPWSYAEYRMALRQGGRAASAYLCSHMPPPGVEI